MMSCIVGAIISACSHSAAMYIDGPVASARSYPAANAYGYAIYAVPIQQPLPIFIPIRRA